VTKAAKKKATKKKATEGQSRKRQRTEGGEEKKITCTTQFQGLRIIRKLFL
jgi:hypothetical protein